jgi:hypothetical protein
VRKHRDRALETAQGIDDQIRPGGHLAWSFAAGTTITKHGPARALSANLGERQAVVVAVVPLEKIRIHTGDLAQTRELTGPPRTLQRAGQHVRERHRPQERGEPARLPFTLGGESHVGAPGVLAGDRPGGFAMTDEHNA